MFRQWQVCVCIRLRSGNIEDMSCDNDPLHNEGYHDTDSDTSHISQYIVVLMSLIHVGMWVAVAMYDWSSEKCPLLFIVVTY